MHRIVFILVTLLLCCTLFSALADEQTQHSGMTLYYNPDGGSRYHADINCPSASPKYLPFAGRFSQTQLWDAPYIDLLPCGLCGAPEREARIDTAGPEVTVEVNMTSRMEGGRCLNEVVVRSAEGTILQTLTYLSEEDVHHVVRLVTLRDVNGDGYTDLLLLTARGAANERYTLAVWDAEAGLYRDVPQGCAFDFDARSFSSEITQLELFNAEVADGMLLSCEYDGFFDRNISSYTWDGLSPVPWYWASLRRSGDTATETIGYGSQVMLETTYPLAWYDEPRIRKERLEAIRQLLSCAELPIAQVTGTSWVNLRQLDSKASESLARLLRGESVRVLGETDGWVHVLAENLGEWRTGYIWHNYLSVIE